MYNKKVVGEKPPNYSNKKKGILSASCCYLLNFSSFDRSVKSDDSRFQRVSECEALHQRAFRLTQAVDSPSGLSFRRLINTRLHQVASCCSSQGDTFGLGKSGNQVSE
jgi:hypothetical protein